jgi:hypothetical protein
MSATLQDRLRAAVEDLETSEARLAETLDRIKQIQDLPYSAVRGTKLEQELERCQESVHDYRREGDRATESIIELARLIAHEGK